LVPTSDVTRNDAKVPASTFDPQGRRFESCPPTNVFG
jgi:hypothetical protein